jgi:hypothetical protein
MLAGLNVRDARVGEVEDCAVEDAAPTIRIKTSPNRGSMKILFGLINDID